MVDDEAWARPPDPHELESGAAPTETRSRARLAALVGVLAVVVLAGVWVVAAKQGVNAFAEASGGGSHEPCDGELDQDDVRPDFTAPTGLPEELDEVAAAFEAFFRQGRWSFSDVAVDEDGVASEPIRFSGDGDLFERRTPDGFVGLIKPGAGIARYEGDRFWVPACVNGFPFITPFRSADCVEASTEGTTTEVRWATLREGTCDDAVVWWSATLEDGDLTRWAISADDRAGAAWEVREPRSLSWPSPVWIAPSWLVRDGD